MYSVLLPLPRILVSFLLCLGREGGRGLESFQRTAKECCLLYSFLFYAVGALSARWYTLFSTWFMPVYLIRPGLNGCVCLSCKNFKENQNIIGLVASWLERPYLARAILLCAAPISFVLRQATLHAVPHVLLQILLRKYSNSSVPRTVRGRQADRQLSIKRSESAYFWWIPTSNPSRSRSFFHDLNPKNVVHQSACMYVFTGTLFIIQLNACTCWNRIWNTRS